MTLQGKFLFICNYKTMKPEIVFKANQAGSLQQSLPFRSLFTLFQAKLTKPALVTEQSAEDLLPLNNCTGSTGYW